MDIYTAWTPVQQAFGSNEPVDGNIENLFNLFQNNK